MIKTILWDIDGTLINFRAAERAAVRAMFAEFGFGECTDAMIDRYSEINDGFWKRLERGEISRQQVMLGRFEQFFAEYGLDPAAAPEFNARYQLALGDTIVYCDDSLEIVKSLKGRYKQYAVSNGSVAAQTKKLRVSGFGELMDQVFLSEKLGVEKPDTRFFDMVFDAIGPEDRSTVVIVGDSLTSDMLGGINAGLLTCWYDPEGRPVPEGMDITYVIKDLHEIYGVLGEEVPLI